MKKKLFIIFAMCTCFFLGTSGTAVYADTQSNFETTIEVLENFFWSDEDYQKDISANFALNSGIEETADGGYITTGLVGAISGIDDDIISDVSIFSGDDTYLRIGTTITKYNSNNEVEWSLDYGVVGEYFNAESGIYYLFDGETGYYSDDVRFREDCFSDAEMTRSTTCPILIEAKLLYAISQTTDGGYIALGAKGDVVDNGSRTSINRSLIGSLIFVKFSANGEVEWERAAVDYTTDEMRQFSEDAIDKFADYDLRVGTCETPNMNASGEQILGYCNHTTISNIYPMGIVSTSNNGFALIGGIALTVPPDLCTIEERSCLVSTGAVAYFDEDGDYKNLNVFYDGVNEQVLFTDAVESSDGKIVVTGLELGIASSSVKLYEGDHRGYSVADTILNGLLIKFDNNGTEWVTKTDDVQHLCGFFNLIELSDGGFAAAGFSAKLLPIRAYVAKFDESGDYVWGKSWLDDDSEALSAIATDLVELDNGNIIAVGISAEDVDLAHTIIEYQEYFDGSAETLDDFMNLDAFVLRITPEGKSKLLSKTDGLHLGVAKLGEDDNVVITGIDIKDAPTENFNINVDDEAVVYFPSEFQNYLSLVNIYEKEVERRNVPEEDPDIAVPDTGILTLKHEGIASCFLQIGFTATISLVVVAIIGYFGKRLNSRRKVNF